MRLRAGNTAKPSQQGYAAALEITQTDRWTAVPASQMRISDKPMPRFFEIVGRRIQHPHIVLPCDAIASAIESRHASRVRDAQKDLVIGAQHIFDDLTTGLPRADDKHCPLCRLLEVLVGLGVKLSDRARNLLGKRRAFCVLICCCRLSHLPRIHEPGGRFQDKNVIFAGRMGNVYPAAHRCRETVDPIPEIVHKRIAPQETIRIVARVGMTCQIQHPIWRHKTERVPAIGLPGVPHAAPVEDDVLDPGLLEKTTDR